MKIYLAISSEKKPYAWYIRKLLMAEWPDAEIDVESAGYIASSYCYVNDTDLKTSVIKARLAQIERHMFENHGFHIDIPMHDIYVN